MDATCVLPDKVEFEVENNSIFPRYKIIWHCYVSKRNKTLHRTERKLLLQGVPKVTADFKLDDMFAPVIEFDEVVTKQRNDPFSLKGIVSQVIISCGRLIC